MARKTKATIAFLSTLIIYVSLNSLAHTINPSAFIWSSEDREETPWIASSHSWLDRKACRWLGLCGTAHVQAVQTRFGHRKISAEAQVLPDSGESEPGNSDQNINGPWQTAWSTGPDLSDQWDDAERARRQIPAYVFEYAPLVHLFSGEQFWPCDIAEHLFHVTPFLNYTPIQSQAKHATLRDLDQLNRWQQNGHVFLTSNDNVEDRPPWMEGAHNIPDQTTAKEESWADWDGRVDGDIPGEEDRAQWFDTSDIREDEPCDEVDEGEDVFIQSDLANALADLDPERLFGDGEDSELEEELRKRYGGQRIHVEKTGGRSNAPAVLVVIDKGNGIVDAFWFYFYSFNLGNVVFDVRFGNHIGDWEHCLVRFHNGKPKALFFSAHSAGEAYSYEAVEKIGRRPVIYSAMGTHAMYATPGIHSYILPWGLLHDQTDRGPLWDPLLNAHTYTYSPANDTLLASTANPSAPTEWFYYEGHWGDKFYPLGDHRQYRFAGQYHYVNGPLGPRFKHLNRHKVCQGPDNAPCVVKDWIYEEKGAKRWVS
ncbi:uncharacterized protein ACHE_80270S [Aspergillus chevalieri]|uniref:Vacuolar protein sorting-associated protein 62 n=1 Tax=Aspergillus chevalieri TaxID=182096 RepID=A0A7R7VX76_ASPCH|nr:vacuolar protein sorting-associated protein 62 [Aspergillus chevalieri]BCR92370.1 vacuolar protein sorting-associated protein 62 [Aspergillus chevalieri]